MASAVAILVIQINIYEKYGSINIVNYALVEAHRTFIVLVLYIIVYIAHLKPWSSKYKLPVAT